MEYNEVQETSLFREHLKPLFILVGAFMVLAVKGYVSAKLLMALVILDFLTFNIVSKIPLPVCFLLFMILTTLAVL